MKRYTVSWVTVVRARTEKEARAKAARQIKASGLLVEESRVVEPRDPEKECPHGKLWSVYCDYC